MILFIGRAAPVGAVVVAVASAAGPALAAGSSPAETTERTTRSFTIDHHTGGIAMAEQCVRTSTDHQLTDLCRTIAQTQTADRAELRKEYAYDDGVTKHGAVPTMTSRTLDELAQRGSRYNHRLADEFAKHHAQLQPTMSRCADAVNNRTLDAQCHRTYRIQAQEIQQFQAIAGRNT